MKQVLRHPATPDSEDETGKAGNRILVGGHGERDLDHLPPSDVELE